jgi:hypothetical protein
LKVKIESRQGERHHPQPDSPEAHQRKDHQQESDQTQLPRSAVPARAAIKDSGEHLPELVSILFVGRDIGGQRMSTAPTRPGLVPRAPGYESDQQVDR